MRKRAHEDGKRRPQKRRKGKVKAKKNTEKRSTHGQTEPCASKEGKPFDISENKHTPEPSRRSRKKQADNGIPCSVLSTNYENAKET